MTDLTAEGKAALEALKSLFYNPNTESLRIVRCFIERAAQGAGETEFWMIERGPNEGHIPHVWWKESTHYSIIGEWTPKVHEAKHFCNKEAAMAVAEKAVGSNYAVTSHRMLVPLTPSEPSGQMGVAVRFEKLENPKRLLFWVGNQGFQLGVDFLDDEDEKGELRREWYIKQLTTALGKLAASPNPPAGRVTEAMVQAGLRTYGVDEPNEFQLGRMRAAINAALAAQGSESQEKCQNA